MLDNETASGVVFHGLRLIDAGWFKPVWKVYQPNPWVSGRVCWFVGRSNSLCKMIHGKCIPVIFFFSSSGKFNQFLIHLKVQ